ncbi:hypothetical protein ACSQ67_004194 [Phaseolus vulgaris]
MDDFVVCDCYFVLRHDAESSSSTTSHADFYSATTTPTTTPTAATIPNTPTTATITTATTLSAFCLQPPRTALADQVFTTTTLFSHHYPLN